MDPRLSRSLQQRILMLEEQIDLPRVTGNYRILGSTGKTYQVNIAPQTCTCTCPDHCQRSLNCKHILFVLIQVLNFSTIEIHTPLTRRTLKAKFKTRQERMEVKDDTVHPTVDQKPIKGNDCPICLEPLQLSESIVYCKSTCGNNIHSICMSRWTQHNSSNLYCPLCRGPWE